MLFPATNYERSRKAWTWIEEAWAILDHRFHFAQSRDVWVTFTPCQIDAKGFYEFARRIIYLRRDILRDRATTEFVFAHELFHWAIDGGRICSLRRCLRRVELDFVDAQDQNMATEAVCSLLADRFFPLHGYYACLRAGGTLV